MNLRDDHALTSPLFISISSLSIVLPLTLVRTFFLLAAVVVVFGLAATLALATGFGLAAAAFGAALGAYDIA
jgi:hypothetical protein